VHIKQQKNDLHVHHIVDLLHHVNDLIQRNIQNLHINILVHLKNIQMIVREKKDDVVHLNQKNVRDQKTENVQNQKI
jgi:hypothetical protein